MTSSNTGRTVAARDWWDPHRRRGVQALVGSENDRLRSGVNHLAFHAGSVDDLDRLVAEAPRHGWQLLFPDRHPHAGGPDQYAAYLENQDEFEIELVADSGPIVPITT